MPRWSSATQGCSCIHSLILWGCGLWPTPFTKYQKVYYRMPRVAEFERTKSWMCVAVVERVTTIRIFSVCRITSAQSPFKASRTKDEGRGSALWTNMENVVQTFDTFKRKRSKNLWKYYPSHASSTSAPASTAHFTNAHTVTTTLHTLLSTVILDWSLPMVPFFKLAQRLIMRRRLQRKVALLIASYVHIILYASKSTTKHISYKELAQWPPVVLLVTYDILVGPLWLHWWSYHDTTLSLQRALVHSLLDFNSCPKHSKAVVNVTHPRTPKTHAIQILWYSEHRYNSIEIIYYIQLGYYKYIYRSVCFWIISISQST